VIFVLLVMNAVARPTGGAWPNVVSSYRRPVVRGRRPPPGGGV
jgi:hypothetical protein